MNAYHPPYSGAQTFVVGGGGPSATAASEYDVAAAELDQAISDLEMAVGQLKSRLELVMHDEKSGGANGKGEPPATSVPLIAALERQTSRVRVMTASVDNARTRLCL